jgi:hypothetical protein
MGWEKIIDIIYNLLPSKKEGYVNELNRLLVEYDKALHEGRDSDASIIRKKMKVLREKLGYSDDI